MLRAGLYDAVVLAGGPDHLAAFRNRVADRFLHVHVLARLAGIDGHQRMPVIWRGDYQSVNVFAIQKLSDIGETGYRSAVLVLELRDSLCEDFAVGIAEGHDLHAV
jgi:hypothetical protein